MTITLTPEQQAWIEARVARGEFDSPEQAARQLVDVGIIERDLDEADDLAWAKPLIDEALAQAERGEVMSLEAFQASIRTFLDALDD